ncbi:cyclin-dependent kinase-like 1 [Copidosoma floridanum]|uniref:cyclin-dependent kinase-like 1 n=1 Tax=Copidosoma floridanum TaxID=29053 RepID=UPI0006C9D036|nr:cyclin-dependent kinase-like 1 [Copidosoma floridanum]
MEKYENIEVVGEGSYGVVMKCRHKETGQIVAIKKFLESVENVSVRKLAFREIRLLKRLRHENLVSLIEVFRRKKRFYLVFEYLDHTILDELEDIGGGLRPDTSRRYIFQVLRGLNFCHSHQIMHRDVKPENVLVSSRGVIKLCDFGFARIVGGPHDSCTDYVATRWYRAPELLVGDSRYGKAIDTWAVGCLHAEMLSGEPLFPGDSDIDQLFRITRLLGGLCSRHQALMSRNNNGTSVNRTSTYRASADNTSAGGLRSLRALLPGSSSAGLDFLSQCLRMDPDTRPSCAQLLQHPFFMQDGFADKFLAELREHVARETEDNPLLQGRGAATSTRPGDDRRFSVLSLDEPPRLSSGAPRWHVRLVRESSVNLDRPAAALDPPAAASHRSKQLHQQHQRMAQHLSRPRDLCFVAPSPVKACTYQLEQHKGLLPSAFEPNSQTVQARGAGGGGGIRHQELTLPALAHKLPTAPKRTKLDLSYSHVA